MEGDVASMLPRPMLPPSSPDPASSSAMKYASRDHRAQEAEAEIEKWDAWNACAGMSRTEAKRRYITTLIETMKVYASGTKESRELVGELEFVWEQIRSQSGSSEEETDESPTRKLERAGLKQMDSYASIPPGEGGPGDGRGEGSRLRVLSPVSRGSGDVVEGEDADSPEPEPDDDADDEVFRDARDGSEDNVLDRRRPEGNDDLIKNRKWRRRIEAALTKMTAEIAALREQMSDSRVFGTARSRNYSLWSWMKWLLWSALRQVVMNAILAGVVVIWGRARGDRRAEDWARRRWKDLVNFLRSMPIWRRSWPSSLLRLT